MYVHIPCTAVHVFVSAKSCIHRPAIVKCLIAITVMFGLHQFEEDNGCCYIRFCWHIKAFYMLIALATKCVELSTQQ